MRGHHALTKTALTVTKEFYDEEGKIRLIFSENMKMISREIFEVLQSRFAKPIKRLG